MKAALTMRLIAAPVLIAALSVGGASLAAIQKFSVGPGWVLSVHKHVFSGTTQCKLQKGRASYGRDAVVFDLGRRVDTADAIYRIDDGAPMRSRDDQMIIAERGFSLTSDSLDNPSAGLVRIPVERLQSAQVVRIEAQDNDHPMTFRISGLSAALVQSRGAGCDDQSFR
jgi:hypothetical protein